MFANDPQPILTTGDFTTSSLISPDFKWAPGFSVEGEYGLYNSRQTISTSFLYYWGQMGGSKEAGADNGFFPVLSFSDSTLPSDYVTSANVNGYIRTAILDLKTGYDWDLSSSFNIAASAAIRSAWIWERVNASYNGGSYNAGEDLVVLKNRVYGIGPRIGLTPALIINQYLTFYGEAAVAFLPSWFHVQQRETFIEAPRASLDRGFFGGRWNGDLSVGALLTAPIDRSALTAIDLDLSFRYLVFTEIYQFFHGSQFTLPSEGNNLAFYGAQIALGAHF
jgi:hypothetical protein